MRQAAKEMGLRFEERGNQFWIGGTIQVTKRQDGKYRMETSNGTMLRNIMDEYAAAKIMREAKRRNMTVTRTKAKDGTITVKTYQ